MTTPTISPLAARRLHRLATAFEHGWTAWITEEEAAATLPTVGADAVARLAEGRADAAEAAREEAGITDAWFPLPEERENARERLRVDPPQAWPMLGPALTHQSSSGSVEWTVAPDGAVVVSVAHRGGRGWDEWASRTERMIAAVRLDARGFASLEVAGCARRVLEGGVWRADGRPSADLAGGWPEALPSQAERDAWTWEDWTPERYRAAQLDAAWGHLARVMEALGLPPAGVRPVPMLGPRRLPLVTPGPVRRLDARPS